MDCVPLIKNIKSLILKTHDMSSVQSAIERLEAGDKPLIST